MIGAVPLLCVYSFSFLLGPGSVVLRRPFWCVFAQPLFVLSFVPAVNAGKYSSGVFAKLDLHEAAVAAGAFFYFVFCRCSASLGTWLR
jgi:hypothetical protein